jgi:hypothetical protein
MVRRRYISVVVPDSGKPQQEVMIREHSLRPRSPCWSSSSLHDQQEDGAIPLHQLAGCDRTVRGAPDGKLDSERGNQRNGDHLPPVEETDGTPLTAASADGLLLEDTRVDSPKQPHGHVVLPTMELPQPSSAHELT